MGKNTPELLKMIVLNNSIVYTDSAYKYSASWDNGDYNNLIINTNLYAPNLKWS